LKQILATLLALGPWGIFLFAIIDGAGLPTPGGLDALLLFLTANRPSDAYWFALLALIGSLIGCFVLFFLAKKGGEASLTKYRNRPRFIRFERWFQHYGLLTVFIPALVPIIPLPLKFFILCAGIFEVSPVALFLTLLAARVPRYTALAYLGQQLGAKSYPWLKSHLWHLFGFALALFAFLYLLIVLVDRRHRLIAQE
jgi:membrane protein YqaA with SNARE-associated domain